MAERLGSLGAPLLEPLALQRSSKGLSRLGGRTGSTLFGVLVTGTRATLVRPFKSVARGLLEPVIAIQVFCPRSWFREAALPYFKGEEFTTDQLHIMKAAAAECAGILGVRGNVDTERDIALSIIEAMRSGCTKRGDLVAVGLAVIRRRSWHS